MLLLAALRINGILTGFLEPGHDLCLLLFCQGGDHIALGIIRHLHHIIGHHVLHDLYLIGLEILAEVGVECEVTTIQFLVTLSLSQLFVGLLEFITLLIDVVQLEIFVGNDITDISALRGKRLS